MTKINLYNIQGDTIGEIELADAVFGLEIDPDLLHQAVVRYLANQRQGTQKAKGQSEVRGGGRKPYRQKGTGRARQGSSRAPNHVGGGVVFAPQPRSYRLAMPKKMRRKALLMALSNCVQDDKLKVVDEIKLATIKTKVMAEFLKKMEAQRSTLIILEKKDTTVEKSAANLPAVQVEYVNTINVYDLMKYDHVLMSQAAVEKLEEVYA